MAQLTLITSTMNYAEYQCSGEVGIIEIENMYMNGLECDDPNDRFIVSYDNKGEPFREGICIGVENREFSKEVTVMLEDREAIALRDFLNKMYPQTGE